MPVFNKIMNMSTNACINSYLYVMLTFKERFYQSPTWLYVFIWRFVFETN